MNDPRQIRIADFTYELPEDRIAHHPLAERDLSKLLVFRNGNILDRSFRELAEEIPAGSLMIFNSTKVVRARLLMQRESGAQIEIFCTENSDPSSDFISLLHRKNEVNVRAFLGNAKRWKEDEILTLSLHHEGQEVKLMAKKVRPVEEQWIVSLSWTPESLQFSEILEAAGKIPLPPYIPREEDAEDAERYQTVYAKQPGSVAAPTAGLHFTPRVLNTLDSKNIRRMEVQLHVGAGTFKPVKSESMQDHDMHREQIFIPRELVKALLEHKGEVVVVGTTSLRTLESLYWFGRQLVTEPGTYRTSIFVDQWEPYSSGPVVPPRVALQAVLDWAIENHHETITGFTELLIAPGYEFRLAHGLITNFHQPQSTLLLLVAAFSGGDFKPIYDHALKNGYRFLSYGDSSLLWRKGHPQNM